MSLLSNIQIELNAPKNQFNGFGKYKYRSLEDIFEGLKPLLKKYKCSVRVYDEIVMVGDRFYIKAMAYLDGEDGKTIATGCGWARESLTKKGMDDSQVTGATSSYARKYALNGLFAIDDVKDADSMNNSVQPEKKPPPSKATDTDKKQAWSKFSVICGEHNVDPQSFLSSDIDMSDKTLVYKTVRQWINSEDLLRQSLDNFEG